MAVPKRRSSLSQIWLPGLLFVLSVVSILFTLRNDDIPVIGPSERPLLNESDIDKHRDMISNALQAGSSWREWCENTASAKGSLHFAHFEQAAPDKRWTDLRRSLPQREQDALIRCQSAGHRADEPLRTCFFLNADNARSEGKASGLHLVEMNLELRAMGRKKVYSCREALAAAEQPMELAAWYTYYWTTQTDKKPLRFKRITGGTRVFPPTAQNTH